MESEGDIEELAEKIIALENIRRNIMQGEDMSAHEMLSWRQILISMPPHQIASMLGNPDGVREQVEAEMQRVLGRPLRKNRPRKKWWQFWR